MLLIRIKKQSAPRKEHERDHRAHLRAGLRPEADGHDDRLLAALSIRLPRDERAQYQEGDDEERDDPRRLPSLLYYRGFANRIAQG